MLITGQIHSREHMTPIMTLYSIMKLIHGGVVNDNPHYKKLLLQNKFYVIPSINVDGVAYIEDYYKKTGKI